MRRRPVAVQVATCSEQLVRDEAFEKKRTRRNVQLEEHEIEFAILLKFKVC